MIIMNRCGYLVQVKMEIEILVLESEEKEPMQI